MGQIRTLFSVRTSVTAVTNTWQRDFVTTAIHHLRRNTVRFSRSHGLPFVENRSPWASKSRLHVLPKYASTAWMHDITISRTGTRYLAASKRMYIHTNKIKKNSCEIEDFVEIHLCTNKLRAPCGTAIARSTGLKWPHSCRKHSPYTVVPGMYEEIGSLAAEFKEWVYIYMCLE